VGDYQRDPDLPSYLRDLAERIAALEARPTAMSGAGAPTHAPANGSLYLDTSNNRLYARVAGVWRFTALT